MKLKLNKKKLKNLSKDNQALPVEMTPNVAGGGWTLICSKTPCHDTSNFVECDTVTCN